MEAQAEGQSVVAVRPGTATMTLQRLPYFIGVSAGTTGARGLSMHLVAIPPGAHAAAHVHEGYETAIYVLEGRVETRYGKMLEHRVVSETGDFLFIPSGVPHEAINLSTTETARAIVARNDANEQERVIPYERPGSAHSD